MNSSALARLPFLDGVPRSTIAAVKRVLRPLSVTAGTLLFRTGDDGDACYLVESGLLRVMTAPNGEVLATVGPGAFVGELAVLLGEPRSATVLVEEDAHLLALSRSDLDALMADHPALSVAMSRELGRRIVRTNARFAGTRAARCSVLWPASRVPELAAALLAEGRRVAVAAIAGGALGPLPKGVVRAKAPHYAADDGRVDVVLIGAGDAPSARAPAVVENAEHVLSFGPPPAWLRDAAGDRVVRVDSTERAVRWATGRAVGLAFSSGGSKTVAHMGVIVALREAGIHIDAVAGSSGGAIAAAVCAFGNSESDGARYTAELERLTNLRGLDLNVPPRSGLAKGKRLRDAMAKWRFGAHLEDAPVPLWLVAADMATGGAVVLHEGPTADAVRASMSVPGVFDPWRIDDHVLIDGAVANPLPTDVLRAAGCGVVIASNVAGQANEIDVNGRLPGLGQIVSRVLNTMERERIRVLLPLADVVIRPRVSAGNTFDFSNNEASQAAGRQAAQDRIADIRSLLTAASSVATDAAHDR
jgi:NTE family protein